MNDGGPAFPIPTKYDCEGGITYVGSAGLTVRDVFAASALTGLLMIRDLAEDQDSYDDVVRASFSLADTMIQRRYEG